MRNIYRTFFLATVLLLSASEIIAAGHTVSLTGTNVLCFNACSGTAAATVSGGAGPFSYTWMPGNLTGASVTNLCAQSYTCTVIDLSDASTATATIAITQPPQLMLVLTTSSPALCGNSNGSAQVSVSGGTPGYAYTWAPSGGNTPFLNNAPAGVYTCTATDANGCMTTLTVNIANAPPPVITSIVANPPNLCAGQQTQLLPTVSGGTGPYTYNWTNANSSLSSPTVMSPIAFPTVTTTYTLTVVDANGCANFNTITITVGQAVTANVSSTDPTCNQSNGSLTVNVTQAAPPFTVLWSNSQTSTTISNLPAGPYSVTVTDANGCTTSVSSGLSNIGGPVVTTSTTSTGCTNSATGTASATVSGIAPFTYTWNTTPAQNTPTATALGAGNYLVTVTDSAGCVSVVPANVAAVTGNLFMYAAWQSPANCNQPTGSAFSVVQGGTPPYNFLWSDGSTGNSLNMVPAGAYSLTVSDQNGCAVSGNVIIPSQCANVVMGNVFYDVNQDSVFNTGDFMMSGVGVHGTPYGYYTVTNSSGYYQHSITFSGQTTLTLSGLSPGFTVGYPSSGQHAINFMTLGDTVSGVDFALFAAAPFQDLYLSVSSGVARPGFVQLYSVHAENRGSTTVSDTIWFRHDSILSLIGSNPPFDGYTYPEGYWLFNNFAPGAQLNYDVHMQVPTIQNGGYLGRQLIGNARIEPTSGDITSPDNGDDEVDIIQGAYDPNLKECWSPTMNTSGDIWPTDITLDYTIHFQNSGTDTAFTVVVVDTLPAELDITTFRMGASSHPCTYSISGFNDTNVVTFTFMNILLPDSNINEPESHGYLQFTIDRFANLPIGTTISNEANNYFDFNPAIVTNLNVLTIWDPMSVTEPVKEDIRVYPNPASSSVNVVLSAAYASAPSQIVIRDVSGREVARVANNGAALVNVPTDGLGAGAYLISIESPALMTQTQPLIISTQ